MRTFICFAVIIALERPGWWESVPENEKNRVAFGLAIGLILSIVLDLLEIWRG